MYLAAGITEQEYRDSDIAIRKELLERRRREVDNAKNARLWSMLGSFAMVGIPIIGLLGISAWFRIRAKPRRKHTRRRS